MTFAAPTFVNQEAIAAAVHKVQKDFASQVVRISHSFGEDHLGAPAVFFRILVRDEAAPIANLRELAQRLSIALMNEARTDENGLHVDFRSLAEQRKLQDPEWD